MVYAAIIFLVFMVVVEGVVRVGFFVAHGFSPYYLTFGFVGDIERHSAEYDGYTKFQPNTTYHYRVNRDLTFAMKINGDGFRSTTEFVKPKPAGTVRVISLGESSTFGLANNDDETYPYLLQQELRSRVPDRPVEVYNLGIPHYRTNHILAVARAEVDDLQPDIVTFYAGYNNSMMVRPQQTGFLLTTKDWLKHHLVTYRALNPYVASAYQNIARMMGKDVVGLATLSLPVELPAAAVAQRRAESRAEFGRDLEALAETVEQMGAQLVLVTQTYTLRRLPAHGLYDRWRTYGEELAYVDSLLTTNGSVPAPFSTLLIHNDLMNDLRAMAARRGLKVVEGIETLDPDREHNMATYVHLTKQGNQRLAKAIANTLVEAPALRTPAPAAGNIAARQ
ncbi:MAG TPA: GDSL-type esterase/lipase family protein [Longimicrobiales bacterium]